MRRYAETLPERKHMLSVTPILWYDSQAEEAANFYVSLFEDGRILETRPGSANSVMSVSFRICGRDYTAFNGGPHFTFSPAISLFISCDTQAEVDRLWDALSKGGKPSRCGWVTDRFGVSWQVVPKQLGELLSDPDSGRSSRAFQAMMGMSKLDIAALEAATKGG
jgi:predicted 3-demethylubiquinone-9 3-methyltransferase (glyoxalase superfamily)